MLIPFLRFTVTILALVLCLGAAADEPLRITTTNTLLADFARAIGGDAVRVRALVPPTVSPSKYQLKPGDIREVSADELFLRGAWEVWSEKVVSALEGSTIITRTIPIETGGIWGRPEEAKRIAAQVAAELSERRPAQAASFDAGLEALEARIDAAHAQAREVLAAHRAAPVTICQNGLLYLVEPLGLRVVSQLIDKAGSSGMATAGSPKRIAEVIETSRSQGAQAVIYAPQLALEQKCELISTELGVPGVKVPLLPGAMDGAATYPDMVLLTAHRIAAALAASVEGP